MVAHLPPAQLSHRENRIRPGIPEALPDGRLLAGRHVREQGFGHVAQGSLPRGRRPCRAGRGRRSGGPPCPGSCAGSTRPRRGSPAPRSNSASSARRSARSRGRFRISESVEQFVDHPRVVDEHPRQERAAADVHVQLQDRQVEAEQLPQHRLRAERRGHLLEVVEGLVRVGVSPPPPGAVAGRCWPGSAGTGGRQERHRLLGELGQVRERRRARRGTRTCPRTAVPSPRPGPGRGSGRSPAPWPAAPRRRTSGAAGG